MNDPTTKGLLNGNNTEKRRGDESPGFVGAVHTSGYLTDVEIQPTSEKPMYRPTGLSKREMLMIAGLFLLLVLCILFIALYAKEALKKSDRKSEDEKNESIGWILAASGKWASTTFQTKWRLVGFDFSVEWLLYS